VLFTGTWKTLDVSLTGPESKPVEEREPCEQGVVKSPCTTVWRLDEKWNSRMSPTFAVVIGGVNVKPDSPTLITRMSADASARLAARREIEERIVTISDLMRL